MTQLLRRCAVLAAVAALMVAIGGLSRAQDPKAQDTDAEGKQKAEVASGVIVKVDDAAREKTKEKGSDEASDDDKEKKGRRRERRVRMTINTAAVWRDWVRDQAIAPQKVEVPPDTSAAAAQGANSVATKGQPQSEATLVTVVVGPNTRIQVRYRSSTDEASLGAPTPEGAAKAETSRDEPQDKTKRREQRRAERASVDDLKPGLFVEAEFRHVGDRDRAVRVTILRPVGGADTPAAEAVPAPTEPAKQATPQRKEPDQSDQ